MRWDEFLADREARRRRSLAAAAALRTGDAGPGRALLAGWRFGSQIALANRVLLHLADAPPRPGPAEMAALLDPPESLPRIDLPPDTAAWILRREVAARCGEPGAYDGLAWALAHLDVTGAEVERRERASWRAVQWAADPRRDAAAAAMWARWFAGDPWGIHEAWERVFLPEAMAAFTGVMRARHLPDDVQDRVRDDLAGALLPFLIGAEGQIPGWLLLAVRVVETAGDGPTASPAGIAHASVGRLGSCVARHGQRARTAAFMWDGLPDAPTRAAAAERALRGGGEFAEAFLDLHVVLRLVEHWAEGRATDDSGTWNVVLQNRARARARLRAALAEVDRARLFEAVLASDALHARTAAAMRRMAAAWARDALRYDFSFDFQRGLSPRCDAEPEATPHLPPEAGPDLRAWVLLVALKDRTGHLERWVRTGGTGDRDPKWGRLLAEAPDALADPPEPGQRTRTYRRLRMALSDALLPVLASWEPLLRAVIALPVDGAFPRSLLDLLAARWPEGATVERPAHKLGQLHRELCAGIDEVGDCLARLRGDAAHGDEDPS